MQFIFVKPLIFTKCDSELMIFTHSQMLAGESDIDIINELGLTVPFSPDTTSLP